MIYAFISGLIAMGCWAVGLSFFHAWAGSKERLLGIFAAAFWILGFERVFPVLIESTNERHIIQYLIRLAAFLLILYAIVDKNIARTAHNENLSKESHHKKS